MMKAKQNGIRSVKPNPTQKRLPVWRSYRRPRVRKRMSGKEYEEKVVKEVTLKSVQSFFYNHNCPSGVREDSMEKFSGWLNFGKNYFYLQNGMRRTMYDLYGDVGARLLKDFAGGKLTPLILDELNKLTTEDHPIRGLFKMGRIRLMVTRRMFVKRVGTKRPRNFSQVQALRKKLTTNPILELWPQQSTFLKWMEERFPMMTQQERDELESEILLKLNPNIPFQIAGRPFVELSNLVLVENSKQTFRARKKRKLKNTPFPVNGGEIQGIDLDLSKFEKTRVYMKSKYGEEEKKVESQLRDLMYKFPKAGIPPILPIVKKLSKSVVGVQRPQQYRDQKEINSSGGRRKSKKGKGGNMVKPPPDMKPMMPVHSQGYRGGGGKQDHQYKTPLDFVKKYKRHHVHNNKGSERFVKLQSNLPVPLADDPNRTELQFISIHVMERRPKMKKRGPDGKVVATYGAELFPKKSSVFEVRSSHLPAPQGPVENKTRRKGALFRGEADADLHVSHMKALFLSRKTKMLSDVHVAADGYPEEFRKLNRGDITHSTYPPNQFGRRRRFDPATRLPARTHHNHNNHNNHNNGRHPNHNNGRHPNHPGRQAPRMQGQQHSSGQNIPTPNTAGAIPQAKGGQHQAGPMRGRPVGKAPSNMIRPGRTSITGMRMGGMPGSTPSSGGVRQPLNPALLAQMKMRAGHAGRKMVLGAGTPLMPSLSRGGNVVRNGGGKSGLSRGGMHAPPYGKGGPVRGGPVRGHGGGNVNVNVNVAGGSWMVSSGRPGSRSGGHPTPISGNVNEKQTLEMYQMMKYRQAQGLNVPNGVGGQKSMMGEYMMHRGDGRVNQSVVQKGRNMKQVPKGKPTGRAGQGGIRYPAYSTHRSQPRPDSHRGPPPVDGIRREEVWKMLQRSKEANEKNQAQQKGQQKNQRRGRGGK